MSLKQQFKEMGITAKKHGGDDEYSWAVFVHGKPVITGLSKREVEYYKRQVLEFEEGRRAK